MISKEELKKRATYSLECLPEQTPVKGNFSLGDEEADKEIERKIIQALHRGNQWVWCGVRVSAFYAGQKGEDFLPRCSYMNQEHFEESGYYEEMKNTALENLFHILLDVEDKIEEIREDRNL